MWNGSKNDQNMWKIFFTYSHENPGPRHDQFELTPEYYHVNYCSVWPKKPNQNGSSFVPISTTFLRGVLGVRGSNPDLSKILYSL